MIGFTRTTLIAGAISVAVAGVVWMVRFSDWMVYEDLRIVGTSRVSDVAIRHLADLPERAPLVSLDLQAAVAGVERHPWVASATARRVFPNRVVIQVVERTVKALLLIDGLYLVDETGQPFRRADVANLDHPILTGIPPELVDAQPAVARRLIVEALALIDAAKESGVLREEDISEARFSRQTGYLLALRNGGEVLLGFEGPAVLHRLSALASAGVDLSLPYRVDLGLSKTAVVTSLL